MVILYQIHYCHLKRGPEDRPNLFKIMPPDHRAKISTVNPEEVVEILEDSKIFVAAMYPTMVWNLGMYLFFQFTMPYSRLSFNSLVVFLGEGGSIGNLLYLIPIFTKQTKNLQTIVLFFSIPRQISPLQTFFNVD